MRPNKVLQSTGLLCGLSPELGCWAALKRMSGLRERSASIEGSVYTDPGRRCDMEQQVSCVTQRIQK